MTYAPRQKADYLRLLYAGRRDRAVRIREQAAKKRRNIHDAELVEAQLPIIAEILSDYEGAMK